MYAIIRTGGNQYRVRENDEIEVEKLDVPEGEKFNIEDVLAIGDGETLNVGTPKLEGAVVEAELLEQGIGDEVIVFKYKPKKKYRKKNIHQQPYSKIKITNIELSDSDVNNNTENTEDNNLEPEIEVSKEVKETEEVDTNNNTDEES